MAADAALQRLGQIKHIVVLMMENRSFDHMLGYLKHANPPLEDLNGLEGTESNPDDQNQPVQVFPWGASETAFQLQQDPSGKILDPCHSEACVAEQIKDGNTGFVRNFVQTRKNAAGERVAIPPEYHGFPMGYYTGAHLPTYDFLAREFCVCDAWHSAVPGDTWPNRMFAVAGRKGDRAVPFSAPIFDVPAFTRQLGDPQWRWYSHDPATLRGLDSRYRDFTNPRRANFAFFNRQRVSVLTEVLESPFVTPDSFLDDAANGALREVSWIDPNFIDLKVLDPNSNDDHPPADIRAGQALVLDIYEALRNSPDWDDTLLVIVYDEHGGFYDHVPPPALSVDDGSGYATYGVRVPAIVAGPRVRRHVSHQLFDHTSLINTILTRFAADPVSAVGRMGTRVEHAAHLGVVLEDEPRSDIADPADARKLIGEWHLEARETRLGADAKPSPAPDGAGRELSLHDFQSEFVRFALTMRKAGLPHGEP
jgi:phospholipase C